MNLGDAADLLPGERMKDHHLIDPVDELGSEMVADLGHDRRLHLLVVLLAGEPLDDVRPQVGSHDHHRIAEIHGPTLAVGQAAVVQHLEQHVEDIGVRLLDLIQQ